MVPRLKQEIPIGKGAVHNEKNIPAEEKTEEKGTRFS